MKRSVGSKIRIGVEGRGRGGGEGTIFLFAGRNVTFFVYLGHSPPHLIKTKKFGSYILTSNLATQCTKSLDGMDLARGQYFANP